MEGIYPAPMGWMGDLSHGNLVWFLASSYPVGTGLHTWNHLGGAVGRADRYLAAPHLELPGNAMAGTFDLANTVSVDNQVATTGVGAE
jgi:hypothetical protein